jgi:hypothetical protein
MRLQQVGHLVNLLVVKYKKHGNILSGPWTDFLNMKSPNAIV